MIGLLCFVLTVLASPFKSKLRLEAENAGSIGTQLSKQRFRFFGNLCLSEFKLARTDDEVRREMA